MSPKSRFTNANGIAHHYLDFGSEGKPSLICLHGLTRNARDFDSVGRTLSPYYHVRAVDVRGRGDSSWGKPDQYRLSTYVEDLLALVGEWNVRSTSIIGTSMGGLIALLFAARETDRVKRIVLNDIGPEIDPVGLDRILNTVCLTPGVNLDPAVCSEARREPRQIAPNLWGELLRTKADLLVFRGAQSDVLSREVCLLMADGNPHCRWVEVPGVGHPPSLSEPEAIRALREFLHLPLIHRSNHESLEYAE